MANDSIALYHIQCGGAWARSISPEKVRTLRTIWTHGRDPYPNPPASPLLGQTTPLDITSIFADAVRLIPVVYATTQSGDCSRPHAGLLLVRQTIQANEFLMHRIRYRHLSQSGRKE